MTYYATSLIIGTSAFIIGTNNKNELSALIVPDYYNWNRNPQEKPNG